MNLMSLKSLSTWIHLLSMIGTFGALLFYQFGLSRAQRDDLDLARRLGRVCNLLIGIGFVAGLAGYYFTMKISGGGVPGRFHMTVGVKFILLLGIGACLGVGGAMHKKGNTELASHLRWGALGLLALAAFLGEWWL